MSISVNGINLPEAVLNLEYEMMRTQRILEWVLNNNVGLRGPTAAAMQGIDAEAVQALQKKYPAAGIQVTKPAPGPTPVATPSAPPPTKR